MELPILYYPDARLRQVTQPIIQFDHTVKQMVTDLFDTHYAQKNCAALAAPQLGIMSRITVIDFSENKDQPLCLINPEIVYRSQETTFSEEGCMSIPGVQAKVKRASIISVKALDGNGESIYLEKIGGFMAKCIQHELDHLDGVLFLDHLSEVKKNILLNKYFKKARL